MLKKKEQSVKIVDVAKEYEFYKLFGGYFKNKKQIRTLKIHGNGEISYWNGYTMRGTIELDKTSTCGLLPPNQKNETIAFYIKTKDKSDKGYCFEDPKGQKKTC